MQSTTYKFHSLFICNPVTLIGQPETILEVDGGSIFVDFRKAVDRQAQMDGTSPLTGKQCDTEGDQAAMLSTPGNVRESSQFSSAAAAEVLIKQHPLNRGTPLTIKKNKVARIQVCEIRYNRTKASIHSIISKQ